MVAPWSMVVGSREGLLDEKADADINAKQAIKREYADIMVQLLWLENLDGDDAVGSCRVEALLQRF